MTFYQITAIEDFEMRNATYENCIWQISEDLDCSIEAAQSLMQRYDDLNVVEAVSQKMDQKRYQDINPNDERHRNFTALLSSIRRLRK